MRDLVRAPRPETVPWFLAAALFILLVTLIVASVVSFASVAAVHARTTLSVRSSAAFEGTSASGLLLDNGSVTLTIYFDVSNPTSRSLSFFTVGYKVWLEDAPAEAHVSGITRNPVDVAVMNESGTFLFFQAFEGSIQTRPFPVPANEDTTMPFPLNLTRTTDPSRFAAVQNITNYALNVHGTTSGLVWNVWVVVNLDIGGIPAPSLGFGGEYFTAISRVQFIEGADFGQGGVPVSGP